MKKWLKKMWKFVDGNKTTIGLALWIIAPHCGAATAVVQAVSVLVGGTGVAHKAVKTKRRS